MQTRAVAAAAFLKAIANDCRLMILCELLKGERSVGEMAPVVGLSQSALSQHLAKLRRHGLVSNAAPIANDLLLAGRSRCRRRYWRTLRPLLPAFREPANTRIAPAVALLDFTPPDSRGHDAIGAGDRSLIQVSGLPHPDRLHQRKG